MGRAPYAGMRTEPCVCGGVIHADLRHVGAAVAAHQDTSQHRDWRRAMGGELCGVWMRHARQGCARRAGHAGTLRYPDHRTRQAMDCAAASRRTGTAA